VDKTIAAPEVELEAIEEIAPQPKISKNPTKGLRTGEVNAIAIDRTPNTRSDAIKDLLRLDHLNREEADHVDRIIGKYSDLFRLPDEPLGHPDVTAYRISTVDERPVSTKQYRFPPIHKDEINKQVKDLLENDIIKASDSPYNSLVWVVPKKPKGFEGKQKMANGHRFPRTKRKNDRRRISAPQYNINIGSVG